MPEICRFYGIVIAMYHREHAPPHFHARYGGDKAAVEIGSLKVLEGGFRRVPSALWSNGRRSIGTSSWATGSWPPGVSPR